MYKKALLIDLDGVLNTYTGNYAPDYIPPMKDGADEFLKKLSKKYEIYLFTTRDKLLAARWCVENGISDYFQNITNIKSPAYLIIDDRCINFNGDYSELETQIEKFKVWYKKQARNE